VLRFRNGAGRIFAETPLAQNQEVIEEAAGEHRVSASVLDTLQLRRWIMGLGSTVTVVAPQALRQWICTEHQAAASAYGP